MLCLYFKHFCGASKAKRDLGITLFVISLLVCLSLTCLSVCLSAILCFCLCHMHSVIQHWFVLYEVNLFQFTL